MIYRAVGLAKVVFQLYFTRGKIIFTVDIVGGQGSECVVKKSSFYRRIINTQATGEIPAVYRPSVYLCVMVVSGKPSFGDMSNVSGVNVYVNFHLIGA